MALKGTNQEYGRPYNRRIVLETIRVQGPIARGEIAKRVGLTVQTVSTIIRELEANGFLLAAREERRRRGYPATELTINPDGGHAIGLHVTPRGIEAALINLAGAVIARRERKLPRLKPAAAFDAIGDLVVALRKQKPRGRMLGIGLAMPGPFDVESMSFVGPTTLEGWNGVPIRERLAEKTNLPAFIEVDHAAAALGERLYGAARDIRDFYYLFFGVGLGGCMVQDGNTLRGSHGNAGEIGHLPMVPGGEACPCGNLGCLERYLSCDAMERRAQKVGTDGWIKDVTPLFRSAIVAIENLFDPLAIVIGGIAPPAVIDKLMAAAQPLPHSVAERRDRSVPRIIRSANGEDAVLRGAAALAVSGVLSPRIGLTFAANDPLMEREAAA
ncbi:ROK family transcriptional regulator [Dongia sedimenti]|uniref:ROK family transcriptional regulator n=1 Tax=Dongia sedimenti TaxID=3064282 RepID=A0ABU0YPR0_9PROT|nr:ROK family transcriptional regulator [Rhodospirillaceae bacterium R-7]